MSEKTANSAPAAIEAEAAQGRGDLGSLDFVIDLPVRLSVEVGRTRLLLRDVLSIADGSVLELDRDANAAADVLVNGRLIARGDLTTVDDRLAVRIVEVIQPGSGVRSDD